MKQQEAKINTESVVFIELKERHVLFLESKYRQSGMTDSQIIQGLIDTEIKKLYVGRGRDLDAPSMTTVKKLRKAGLSWRQIADECGCTMAMARRRFVSDGIPKKTTFTKVKRGR